MREAAVDYENILYRVEDGIARLILNRPEVRNAQSRPLLEELDRAFLEAEADPAVRVIVLSGACETFSAGHDLGSPQQNADTEARPAVGLSGRYRRIWDLYIDMGLRWRNLEKPTMLRNIRNLFMRAELAEQEIKTLRGVVSSLTRTHLKRKEPKE